MHLSCQIHACRLGQCQSKTAGEHVGGANPRCNHPSWQGRIDKCSGWHRADDVEEECAESESPHEHDSPCSESDDEDDGHDNVEESDSQKSEDDNDQPDSSDSSSVCWLEAST